MSGNFIMFSEPRRISEDARPDISSCTFIQISGDRIGFCSQIGMQDIYEMLDFHLPSVQAGLTRLLIAWQGQWRTDVFEVTPDTVNILQTELIDYGRRKFKSFKY